MQILIPVLIKLMLLPLFNTGVSTSNSMDQHEMVRVEILNQQQIPFNFAIEYKERRHQLHIRSDMTMSTLRIVDSDNKRNRYDVHGSGMIMLPLSDYRPGDYIAEFRFQQDPTLILARIHIPEKPRLSDL